MPVLLVMAGVFLLPPKTFSQQKQTIEKAECKIAYDGKSYQLKPTDGGYFQRLDGVQPNSVLPIEVAYPDAKAGEKVVAQVLDGGKLDEGVFVKAISLDADKKCVFNFTTTDQLGLFRVLLTNGFDEKVIQVWVNGTAHQYHRTAADSSSCPLCGNNKKNRCIPCEEEGINLFDPYNGNVTRAMRDLEIWGAVGEIPMVMTRHYNSRDIPRSWQPAFNYLLFDAGTNSSGQAKIDLHYPDDDATTTFTQSTSDPTKWLPLPGVDSRLFQYGNDFYLQLANGHRYRFEKVVIGTATHFFLRELRDQFQNVYTVTYDNINYKKRITEPAGRYLEITFSPRTQISDPLQAITSDGRSLHYNYDTVSDGLLQHIRLRSAAYGDGTQAQYEYSQIAPGMKFDLAHAVDPRLNNEATNMRYSYAGNGVGIAGIIHQEKNGLTGQVMATLDASGDDRKVLYANGSIHTINMPDSLAGSVNKRTDGARATTQYTYDDNGLGFLQTVTDALGRTTTYNAKTIYGNPLKITYPDGSTEEWTRDTLDLVLTYKDHLGRMTTYTRDIRHRPTRIDYPDGTFETFTYNNFSEVLDHRRKNGCTEHFAYNATGLKTSFADCAGNVTAYAYDAADRLAQVTDARDNTTKYEYNERGLLTKMINADNSFKTYTYDAFGNRLTETNELGKTWSTSYDEFKRPKTKKDPLNRMTTYSYDLPGGVCGCSHEKNTPTKITLPSGRMTTYTYDVEWRKIGEMVGAGSADAATTSYQYNLKGNLDTIVDPRGRLWKKEYDTRDRLKADVDPLNHRTEYTYDAKGNQLTLRRADGGISNYTYDVMDRRIKEVDPKAQQTQWAYDAEGNMIKLTDPKGNEYNFSYDVLNRKTKMIYPAGSFEQYAYDAVSNLATYRNRRGDVRTYTYDNRNREILSDWSDATPDVSKTYDAASRITRIASSVSDMQYTYSDANEVLLESTNVTGTGPKVVSYSYNADGLRSILIEPSGLWVNYDYTGRNQMSTIGTLTTPCIASYTYDLNGNRIGKVLNNGTNTLYTYNDDNNLLSLDNRKGTVSFAKYNYDYDAVHRRKYVQYDNANGDVYAYDPIDQVTDVKYNVTNPDGTPGAPARAVNYLWDPAGNRTTVTDNSVPTNYLTNILNQYTAVGANPATYDANGNLATYNFWTYTYDAQNRLIRAEQGPSVIEFQYDGRNRCVKRSSFGNPVYYYYDGWSLIEERDGSGAVINSYLNGDRIDEIISKTSPANTVYYHYNGLGSVVRLTDNAGNVVEKYNYDVFGAATIKNAAGTVIPFSNYSNRFMFTGREYISQVDLYDYRNRMYHQTLGRFMQTDLIRFDANDYNLYRIAKNNTVNVSDPTGLVPPDMLCEVDHSSTFWKWPSTLPFNDMSYYGQALQAFENAYTSKFWVEFSQKCASFTCEDKQCKCVLVKVETTDADCYRYYDGKEDLWRCSGNFRPKCACKK
ncbi:RHS repeat protein [Flavisolibacter ginsenosidimutans]|nr:RHS repeat protein [Flavisolibacter ginsenosidimutans]